MSESLREHILATIAHITTRRSALLTELEKIEDLLVALRKEEESLPRTPKIVFPPQPTGENKPGEYAGISIRWAVLYFLAEHADGRFQPIGVIADALRRGGSFSKAQSFNSNVSAVLSQMVSKGQLSKADAGFTLTEHGTAIWQGIKHSEKFIDRDKAFEGAE